MADKPKSTPATVKLKAAAPKAPRTKIVPAAVQVQASTTLKKREFFERTMTKTEVKKRDAKPAIEAALTVIAEALSAGEEVNLPPLGKIRVVKAKDIAEGAKVLTLKMRTMKTTPKVEGASNTAAAD